MLTILATATADSIAKKEDVKELVPQLDSIDDALLDRLIARSGRRIETYLGSYQIALTKYQAILPAFGGVNLRLPRYPVRDVFRVFDGTDTDSATELSSTEYRVDKERGFVNRDEGFAWTAQVERRMSGPADIVVPEGEYKRWLVEFTAGYIMTTGGLSTDSALWSTNGGSTATGKTLPEDLEEAGIEMVKTAYLSRSRVGGVASERAGDVWVTYATAGGGELPDTVSSILAPYRSVI